MPSPASTDASRDAAFIDRLVAAHAGGAPVAVPDWIAGLPIADAYRLQSRFTERLLAAHGGTVIGTKLGGTNAALLARFRIDAPWRGPLFSAFTVDAPARLPRASFHVCLIEAEIGVRLGRDLDASDAGNRDALADAIDALFPVIEIADARVAGWGEAPAAAVVADLGYAGAWVRGAAVRDWRTHDLAAASMRLLADDVEVRAGNGAAVLGEPLQALAAALNDLGREGRGLRAGDYVSTGSFGAPYPVPVPQRLVADFGPLGRVDLVLE